MRLLFDDTNKQKQFRYILLVYLTKWKQEAKQKQRQQNN
jgi:hypothetical protein